MTDLRTVSFDVPPQEILTKDSVTVAVDAVIYYKISSPLSAVCNVSDYAKSTKLLASTTLRTILGTKNLSEILSDRESIAEDILANLDKATDPWGVKVCTICNIFKNLQHFGPLRSNAWRSKMCGCRNSFSEQWLPRLRPPAKLAPKSLRPKASKKLRGR